MKALIAMSGGVDSSLAAKLTADAGYQCIGCTMKLYDNADAGKAASRTCCSLEDVEDARGVAYQLGMPYYVFNFTEDFRRCVIEHFADSYRRGVTPNPCIDCNRYLKFDRLLKRAETLGCDCLVTGHYARIERENGRYVLKKALDASKDQSYVLYMLTQAQLSRLRFPLGALRKTEVRATAAQNGFLNADKPDSQDICFVPDGDYSRVVELHGGPARPGDFVDREGRVLGRHKGIIHYTVGQRKGLGLSLPEPMYVCRICPDTDQVVLGRDAELWSRSFTVRDMNWISGEAPGAPFRCKVRVRYRQTEQWAEVSPTESGAEITFDRPQRAITPGQAAVLYDGDTVLGGGVICQTAARRECV